MTCRHRRAGLAILTAATIAVIWCGREVFKKPESGLTGKSLVVRTRTSEPDRDRERAVADSTLRRRVIGDWNEFLKFLSSDPPPSAAEIRGRLTATRIAWTEMDPQALSEVLKHLLETGDDAATGLDFKVGAHGFLAGWPTARVFLLDVLAASDPEMAPVIARKILDETASADEFAVAMRSLTREGMGRADDAELLTRFGQMLEHPDWQNSRGFAEALDLARLVGSPEAARQLATWQGNPRMKVMAMDEFAADHPQAMLDILNNQPALTGATRANLMARADPADPRQLDAVDTYFKNPELTDSEAVAFLNSFPLRSTTTGFRLYAGTPSPYTYQRIAAGDRAAMARVKNWADDPALEKHQAGIQALQGRLASWVEQAK